MLQWLVFVNCFCLAHTGFTMFNSANYVLYVVNASHSPLMVVKKCEAALADFGFQFDDDAISGCAVPVEPSDCCSAPLKPPGNDSDVKKTRSCYQRNVIAIAGRGNCTFGKKANLAATQAYSGIIIWNNKSDPETGMVADPHFPVSDQFLVVSVGRECGVYLVQKYNYTTDYSFILQAESSLDLTKFLLPFVIILAVCILVMLMAILIKCFRERRKLMRSRLSKGKLRQIPTRKFQKGEETDTCPICLDDFVEGDKLRVLPCNHVYHCKCVDPWLTKNRKVCPVCKRKVLPNDDDSSSDREEPRRESESQPLLISPEREVGNSTFYSSFDSLHTGTVRGFVASSTSSSSLEGSPVLSSMNGGMVLRSSSSGDSLNGKQMRSTRKMKRTRTKPSGDIVVNGYLNDCESTTGSTVNLILKPEKSHPEAPVENFCDNDGYSASDDENKADNIPVTTASSSQSRNKPHRMGRSKRNAKKESNHSAQLLSESAPPDFPSTSAHVHQAGESPVFSSSKPSKREEIV